MIGKIKTIALKAHGIRQFAQKSIYKLEVTTVAATAFTGMTATTGIVQTVDIFKKQAAQKKVISWEKAAAHAAKLNKEALIKKSQLAAIQRQKSVILQIMHEDKNCAAGIDKDKIATQIVAIAAEYKANPITIACIAKKETHFTENINSGPAKGIMQVSYIAVNELFNNPAAYHEKLREITGKYKTPKALFQAIQKKPSLNIRVGTILYQGHLNRARGNVYKALANYNGSSRKDHYARTIFNDIQSYKLIAQASLKSSGLSI